MFLERQIAPEFVSLGEGPVTIRSILHRLEETILALIMAANVWFVIWPNQKKALGIVPAEDAAKAKAARTAMIASRTNTLLSVPMLLCMTNFH